MQRMRVVVLPANQPNEFDSSELLPGVFRRALPPMPPALPMTREERPRPVRGEILRDQEGRLYEKIGEQIRPLNKLVSGSRGQVLELVPLRKPIFRNPSPRLNRMRHLWILKKRRRENPPGGGRQRKQNEEFNQAGPVARPASETPKPAPYRKLFPDPGQGRVIRLGDFKSMLAPQLAHPERVRDTHRLACYLQVYEVTTVQRLESLAASVLGDAGQVSQLQPMTAAHHAAAWAHLSVTDSSPRPAAIFHVRPDCCCPTKEFFGFSSRRTRQPTMQRLRNGNRQWIFR